MKLLVEGKEGPAEYFESLKGANLEVARELEDIKKGWQGKGAVESMGDVAKYAYMQLKAVSLTKDLVLRGGYTQEWLVLRLKLVVSYGKNEVQDELSNLWWFSDQEQKRLKAVDIKGNKILIPEFLLDEPKRCITYSRAYEAIEGRRTIIYPLVGEEIVINNYFRIIEEQIEKVRNGRVEEGEGEIDGARERIRGIVKGLEAFINGSIKEAEKKKYKFTFWLKARKEHNDYIEEWQGRLRGLKEELLRKSDEFSQAVDLENAESGCTRRVRGERLIGKERRQVRSTEQDKSQRVVLVGPVVRKEEESGCKRRGVQKGEAGIEEAYASYCKEVTDLLEIYNRGELGEDETKAAENKKYKEVVLYLHPDKCGDKEKANEYFQLLQKRREGFLKGISGCIEADEMFSDLDVLYAEFREAHEGYMKSHEEWMELCKQLIASKREQCALMREASEMRVEEARREARRAREASEMRVKLLEEQNAWMRQHVIADRSDLANIRETLEVSGLLKLLNKEEERTPLPEEVDQRAGSNAGVRFFEGPKVTESNSGSELPTTTNA